MTDPLGHPSSFRLLIADDNTAIHRDFRSLLAPPVRSGELGDLARELLGDATGPAPGPVVPSYTLDFAHQGQEALALVESAVADGRPYALAFVDIRMPPGWDGVETIARLWEIDPDLHAIACSAYSDYSWRDIVKALGRTDKLLFLRKPFDPSAVKQIALAVTRKWELDRSHRALVQELERRVSARTAELSDALRELEARNQELARATQTAREEARAKSQFVAHMSHELRTPLSGVLAAAEVLSETELSPEQSHLLSLMRRSGVTLRAVIDDVLDFSKLEAGEVVIRAGRVDLPALIREAADILRLTKRPEVTLVVEVDPALPNPIPGDPERVLQVVMNLLGNAIKFTLEGEVRVCASAAAGEVRVEVRDTGIGIDADDFARLFQPFQQLDRSSTRRFGGTGLGLIIAKRLVEVMGGTIGVDSARQRGSTFWFTLPTDPVAHEPLHPADASAVPDDSRLRGRRLLLVEDNELNASVTSRMLRSLGCTVDIACDGAQAERATAERGYDLVLMDVQMPVQDGCEATRSIRERERGGHAPATIIVAMSAGVMADERARCADAGMDDFLAKPVSKDELRAMLLRWLDGGTEDATVDAAAGAEPRRQ